MEVEQTPLPGVGVRYDFRTAAGRQLGVVAHREGPVDLVVYAEDDPDLVAESVTLQPEEQAALAELLAVPPGESDRGARVHHRTWQLTDEDDA